MGVEPDTGGAGHWCPTATDQIARGKCAVTADTALRLGKYLGNSPQFWLGLQMDYDLDMLTPRLARNLQQIDRVKVY